MAAEETKRPGIMVYFELRPCLRRLTNEQKGILFEALLEYGETGAMPEFDDLAVAVAMDFVKPRIDRDAAVYAAKQEAAKVANEKRWGVRDESGERSETVGDGRRQSESERVANVPPSTSSSYTSVYDEGKDSSASATPRTRSARFTPPTQAEVEQFMRDNGGNSADAGKFCDYYAANGWKVGRAAMRDWRAAARGWLRRDGKFASAAGETDTNKYDLYAAFEGVVNGKS